MRGRPYPNHFLIYKLDILTFNNCLILLTLRDCIPLSAHHYRVLIKRRVCIPPHTIWKNNGCMTLYLWPLYFIDNRSDMSIFVCVCVCVCECSMLVNIKYFHNIRINNSSIKYYFFHFVCTGTFTDKFVLKRSQFSTIFNQNVSVWPFVYD